MPVFYSIFNYVNKFKLLMGINYTEWYFSNVGDPIIHLSYNKYLKFDDWDSLSEENMICLMCQFG